MKRYETAQQNEDEFDRFLGILKQENVRSYLEIGSKFGGTLWKVAQALPVPSTIVSVDMPWGDKSTLPHLQECVAQIVRMGHYPHLLLGDSTKVEMINMVRALAPFDACFIDANHTEPCVRSDWKNYGPMCQIVAFHDIGFAKQIPPGRLPIEVPKVWNEIKREYRHEEIKLDRDENGIGVLWRHSDPLHRLMTTGRSA